jgi:hypothetical protein
MNKTKTANYAGLSPIIGEVKRFLYRLPDGTYREFGGPDKKCLNPSDLNCRQGERAWGRGGERARGREGERARGRGR